MRTEYKTIAYAAVGLLFVLKTGAVWAAATTTSVAPPTVPNPAVGTLPVAPATTVAAPAPVATAITPADAAKSLPMPGDTAAAAPDAEKGKSLANAEDKVSDSVKNVAKHLGTTENVTLDDLNSAKQAVAKIEALIEIEKRLNELERLRNDREGHSISAIPASALGMNMNRMPQMAVQQPQGNMEQAPMPMMMGEMDVSRITGSAGQYRALIKGGDGQLKNIRVGERVPGYGTVADITSSGVVMEQGGARKVIRVKNIDTVFTNTP